MVRGLLPTGMDFGIDGSLYFSDWVEGWGIKNKGRIWKLDVPNEANSLIRQETKKLPSVDFSQRTASQLSQSRNKREFVTLEVKVAFIQMLAEIVRNEN